MKYIIAISIAVASLAAEMRTGTEDLPLDSFDTYAGSAIIHPWRSFGTSAGVTVTLRADGESPFISNSITGKGVVIADTSASAGDGAGFECSFTPPPMGDFYIGFDLRLGAGDRAPAVTAVLSDNAGKGFQIVADNELIIDANGKREKIAALVKGKWYHLSIVIGQHGSFIALTDFPEKRTVSNAVSLPPLRYASLRFLSTGGQERIGDSAVDSVITAGKVDAPREQWWPFRQAPIPSLQSAKRKVFSYYFPIFVSGLSDEDPAFTWYTRTVLNPGANNKKDRADAGSELQLRPLPRPPLRGYGTNKAELLIAAMEEEVRLARAQGNDGFLVDFFSAPNPKSGGATFSARAFAILDAAQRVDPAFKIVPAVYSPTIKNGVNGEADEGVDPIEYARSPYVKRLIEHPSTLKLPDGRTVFSMWLTERHSTNWWRIVMEELSNQNMPIALVAQFNSYGQITNFSPLCYGMAHWGPRSPVVFDWIERIRDLTSLKIFPIAPQDVRTRGCWLFEACNSEALRTYWNTAIHGEVDWVFLNTWSDFTEQPMEPSTTIGFGPYDMNAYFIQWFKTGTQPAITRDVLYYVYRRHHTDVDPGRGVKWTFRGREAENTIELVGFLSKAGTLGITINGTAYETNAPAGIVSFKVPLPPKTAFVPSFLLKRDGKTVIAGDGRYAVVDSVEYPNLFYCYGVLPGK